ncbi:non-specific lipid-transfer protein 1-like [Asparagus officinalis]|uniref:non-specific lipid-transfer protein 1-like n=1 Tax=Asparagus officinalis TaxID=4686 RepID=UPI00098E7494|nr:non-specific lipid-transfer protein 1-like [Asparagus officinalis]
MALLLSRRLLLLFLLSAIAISPSQSMSPTCKMVARMITPCVAYLADRAWAPYGPCCSGVAALNQTASTGSVADRVAVCDCIKSIAPRLPMVDLNRAAVLPRTCGLNLNLTLSPTMDCDSFVSP